MSVQVVKRVWDTSQVSGRPLIVLLALAHLADSKGEVGTTAHDLQHRCRLNVQQLEGCLEQLIATRHIAVKGPDAEHGRLFIRLFPEKGWARRRTAQP